MVMVLGEGAKSVWRTKAVREDSVKVKLLCYAMLCYAVGSDAHALSS